MSPIALLQKLSVVHLLMASVVLVSLLGFAHERSKRALMLNPYLVTRGQVYRLLTAGWVHGDAGHLLFNLLAFYIFADRVLAALGQIWFVVLYVSAAVVAFVPTTVRYRRKPRYNSLGASGAVAAVMLSAILLDPTIKLRFLFFPVAVPGFVFAILYLAYSAWQSRGSGDGINHDAHFSGALYGIVMTYALLPGRVERSLRSLLAMLT
jgi:membrane associated rhomboid family serine protease